MTAIAAVIVAWAAWGLMPIGIMLRRAGPRWFALMPRLRLILRVVTGVLVVVALTRPLEAVEISALCVASFFLLLSFVMHPDVLFPSLADPHIVRAAEASVSPSATVIGVTLSGESRAYVLDEVARLHLVNDTLGGTDVLVSYCPLCRSAVVYASRVGHERLRFTVAGFWRRNMLMRDQHDGIWQQTSGEGLAGALVGTTLEVLPAEQCTFSAWINERPDSSLMSPPPPRALDFRRLIPLEWGFGKFAGRINAVGPFSHGRVDPRLPARTEVAGVVHAGESRAYALPELARLGTVDDAAFGTRVRVSYDAGADRVRCVDTQAKRALSVKRELWVAWSEFHPGTSVWNGDQEGRDGAIEAANPGVRGAGHP